ncbi:hypothetical protein LXL04_036329 [Taraxacum kok-saghyz]
MEVARDEEGDGDGALMAKGSWQMSTRLAGKIHQEFYPFNGISPKGGEFEHNSDQSEVSRDTLCQSVGSPLAEWKAIPGCPTLSSGPESNVPIIYNIYMNKTVMYHIIINGGRVGKQQTIQESPSFAAGSESGARYKRKGPMLNVPCRWIVGGQNGKMSQIKELKRWSIGIRRNKIKRSKIMSLPASLQLDEKDKGSEKIYIETVTQMMMLFTPVTLIFPNKRSNSHPTCVMTIS